MGPIIPNLCLRFSLEQAIRGAPLMVTLYQPARFFHTWIRGALRRYNCGRRFGHFPVPDTFGPQYLTCARCECPLL